MVGKSEDRVIHAENRFFKGEKEPMNTPVKTTLATTLPLLLGALTTYLTIQSALGLLGTLVVPMLVVVAYLLLWNLFETKAAGRTITSVRTIQEEQARSLWKQKEILRGIAATERRVVEAEISGAPRASRTADESQSIIEFHLGYRVLRPSDLAGILTCVERIYRDIYAILDLPEESVRALFEGEVDLDRLWFETERHIRSRAIDSLRIDHIATGNSITFRVGTGWRPSAAFEKEGLVVTLPKGAAALLASGLMITGTVNYGAASVNEVLNAVKTWKEIQKIELEIEKIENAPPLLKEQLERDLGELLDRTTGSEESRGFEVRIPGVDEKSV